MTVKLITINTVSIALCFALGATVSYILGQDIDYDQLNYHYYTVYAFLTHRLDLDVAPAQIVHGFFNPLPYLPFYWLIRHVAPFLAGVVLGGIHGLNLWLVGLIAWQVVPGLRLPARIAGVLAAVAISAASPMAISEIGGSLADVMISLLVSAGLAALLPVAFGADERLRLGLGAALIGAAVGLKLTAAPFAIGVAVAIIIGWSSWRDRLSALAIVAMGGVGGFAVTGGYWCLMLWRRFGNPFFPYYNAIFRSSDYGSTESIFDKRFLPQGLLDAMSYPFGWVTMAKHASSELDFADIRFAVLIVLGLLAMILGGVRTGSARPDIAGRRLLVFSAVAFAVWMYVWSIQRYLVPLELLTGPAILFALQAIARIKPGSGWAVPAAGATVAILSFVTVHRVDFGRLPWAADWYIVQRPLPEKAQPVYFLDDTNPLAYVVPGLERGSMVIGITPWERFSEQPKSIFMQRIEFLLDPAHHDALRAISVGPPSESFSKSLGDFGLTLDGNCATTPGRPLPLTWCGVIIAKGGN